jgi:hypothetical protein
MSDLTSQSEGVSQEVEVSLRIPRNLYQAYLAEAKQAGVSIEQHLVSILQEAPEGLKMYREKKAREAWFRSQELIEDTTFRV